MMRAKSLPLACNPVNHVYTPTSDSPDIWRSIMATKKKAKKKASKKK